jgi:DNA-binding NtrC family response regulator
MADRTGIETVEDKPSKAPVPRSPMLVCVVAYRDLLADVGAAFVLDRVSEVVIERAPAPADPTAPPEPPSLVRCSSSASRLLVHDGLVSREHARISCAAGGAAIEDLGSRNGVIVNGIRRPGTWPLHDRDVVELGHTMFVFRMVEDGLLAGGVLADRPFGPTRTRCPELITEVRNLEKLAPADRPVLIRAETGTGKETAARLVHDLSPRARQAYVPINCATIPEPLFESILFGTVKGAHSEAKTDREGLLATADKGTLFLDEIGDLPPACQPKLLRVLDSGELYRVGATRPSHVDIRWVVATHKPLDTAADGFRRDLLHRLADHVVSLPALRNRREDMGELARHFLREARVERAAIAAEAARALFLGHLGGNLRELRAALVTAAKLADAHVIEMKHLRPLTDAQAALSLPDSPVRAPAEPRAAEAPSGATGAGAERAKRHGSDVTREELLDAIERSNWVYVKAAEEFGVTVRTLRRWVNHHGINRPEEGPGAAGDSGSSGRKAR